MEQRIRTLRERYSDNHPEVQQLRTQLAALDRQLSQVRTEETMKRYRAAGTIGRRAMIDTSFTMDIGETVVVGTSRLKGDKALIALLTAVASTKTSTR
jgi:phage shock protein A